MKWRYAEVCESYDLIRLEKTCVYVNQFRKSYMSCAELV